MVRHVFHQGFDADQFVLGKSRAGMVLRLLTVPTDGLDLLGGEFDTVQEGHVSTEFINGRASELDKNGGGEGGSTFLHGLQLLFSSQTNEALGDDDAKLSAVSSFSKLSQKSGLAVKNLFMMGLEMCCKSS